MTKNRQKSKKRAFIAALSLFLVPCMIFLCSCRRHRGGQNVLEEIDKSKTQLYVGNYKGGYGDQWLWNAKPRFEELFKDESFESGKRGVQIIIKNKDRQICGPALFDNVRLSGDDVVFTEGVYYHDYVEANRFLDITDCVTEPLTEFGETKSIEDKMFDYHIRNFRTKDGKYYALPFYEAFHGIIYDADLFEEENYYFADNRSNGNGGFVTGPDDKKSKGLDGEYGTDDDGLPLTYADFYLLCDRIKESGNAPVTWSGQYPLETTKTVSALDFDYEGPEQAMLNVTFSGKATTLVEYDDKGHIKFDEDGRIVYREPVEIKPGNEYLIRQQAGKYYALEFINTIVDNEYYADLTYNQAQSNTGVQEEFLYSRFSSKKTPIAMLIDGSYWENEAKSVFEDMVNGGYGEAASRKSRRFAFMPYPKATADKVGEPTTFTDINYSTTFVNAVIDPQIIPLAKKFVRFLHTDREMREYTATTNTPKPFDFEMTQEYLDKMTHYGRSLYKLHSSGTIIYPSSENPFFAENQWLLTPTEMTWNSVVNRQGYGCPVLGLREPGVDAEGYFKGLRWLFE